MKMGNDRSEWLQAAAEIGSYRRMYEFAEHVIESALATAQDRRAARRVYRALKDIIELPIADAARLMKARKYFVRLVDSLRSAADGAVAPFPC